MKVRRTYLSVLAFVLVSLFASISVAVQAPAFTFTAFTFTAFTFTQLDVPGSVSTEADGINAQGEIIGFFVDASGKQHGFLRQHASFTQLDFPGATATRTVAINDAA